MVFFSFFRSYYKSLVHLQPLPSFFCLEIVFSEPPKRNNGGFTGKINRLVDVYNASHPGVKHAKIVKGS